MTETVVEVAVADIDEALGRLRLPAPPSVAAAMRASLERHGQLSPIVTRASTRPVLIDGFKRLHAARALGRSHLSTRTLPLSDEAAIVAMYSLNRAASSLTDLEEAFVVRALCREHELDQHEVAQLLGHHPSWVSRRLSLAERLCETVQQDLRVGLLSSTAAREVARLPRGTQPKVAACAHRHRLSTRELADFITLFERTPEDNERAQLLREPRARLPQRATTTPQSGRPIGVSKEAARVVQLILHASEAMTRMYRYAEPLKPETFGTTDDAYIRPAVRQLVPIVETARPLLTAWRELLGRDDESNAT